MRTGLCGTGGIQRQQPPPERQRPHGQQHPAHIGMPDNGAAALGAQTGEIHGPAKRPLRHRHTLHRNTQPRGIHHGEHAGQPAMRWPYQLTNSAFKRHHTGRARVDAQLVLDRHAGNRIAAAIGQEFRHGKQRYPGTPRRRVGQARQHHMQDIIGELMLAPGDVDLLAGDGETARNRARRGAHAGEVGAGLRLGEAHRPGPAPIDHRRHQAGFLVFGAMRLQQGDGVLRQHGAEAKRHIGGRNRLERRQGENMGQSLPAMIGGGRNADPAPFGIGPKRLGKTGGGDHLALLQPAAMPIAGPIQRRQQPFGGFGGLLQHRQGLFRRHIRKAQHSVQQPGGLGGGNGYGHVTFLSWVRWWQV